MVDRNAQTFLVRLSDGKRDQLMNWKRTTRFIHNRQFTSVAALPQGTPVVVFYRTPFFGKPYVTKVIWDNITGKK
jgi:hypothetical protein